MSSACDVAIVGGGIGGLVLAISLLQQSISVQIFEQNTELREIGAGVAIGGNATRLLQRLGLDLAQVVNVPPAFEVRCWKDGGLLWSQPMGEWYRGLADLPDEPAGVRLRFENGDEVVASMVVGADGVQSTARRYVCGSVQPTHSGEIGIPASSTSCATSKET